MSPVSSAAKNSDSPILQCWNNEVDHCGKVDRINRKVLMKIVVGGGGADGAGAWVKYVWANKIFAR